MSVIRRWEHVETQRELSDGSTTTQLVAAETFNAAVDEIESLRQQLRGAVDENERLRQAIILARQRLETIPLSPRLVIAMDTLDAALDGGQ